METLILNQCVGKKIGLLAKANGYTQAQLAEKCGVSRITIQRFFSGKTEIRSKDLCSILELLDIDIETMVDNSLKNISQGNKNTSSGIINEVEVIFNSLDTQVQKTLLKNMCWWAAKGNDQQIEQSSQKIIQFVHKLENESAIAK